MAGFAYGFFEFKSFKSQSYRNTLKVMQIGKVNFDPLHVSYGHCGCIFDNRNLKLSCLMRN